MDIQAVIFDLDNTLTHRDLSIQAYSQQLVQQYHLQLDDINTIQNIIREIDQGGYPDPKQLTHSSIAASVAFALLQQLQWQVQPSLQQLTEYWFSHFPLSAVAMPDAEAVLIKLRSLGLKIAVLSNGAHASRLSILQGLGFSDYFDEIISSELAGVKKPNPAVFEYVCQRLNVEPSNALYVGDHPINDFYGATQAGLNALLLDGFHENTLDAADKITQLHQILDFIQ